jgi:phosphoribosylformimino-5-aminoimidazole carboxamide ribotide isomerase
VQLIPVIDLLDGQAVHAVRGERSHYRPLVSTLAHGSDPLAIADALLQLHPFTTLYVADLDAILGRADNRKLITRLHRRHPDLALWVDAGIGDDATLSLWLAQGFATPVIGSESVSDPAFVVRAQSLCNPVLSLDFRGDEFLGPPTLLSPQYWPQRVIAMTLARVGSAEGPDMNRLRRLRDQAPERQFFAAGGVRDSHELQRLGQLGAAGVLLASALHAGAISAAQIRSLASP